MSLGVKQLSADPWTTVIEKYAIGSQHTATVRNFTNFGIFVELEEGVDGLIHISDLSWSKKIKHPSEFCKIGDKIEVKVLEMDSENRRLSLGHKQLEENPWEVFETVFTLDSVHLGTVTQVTDKGAVIALPYGVEGFAPTRHLLKADGTSLKAEEQAEFKVLEFNKESKKIIASHAKIHDDAIAAEKAVETEEKKTAEKAEKKAVKKVKESVEKTTFGDISALSDLRDELQESEKKKK
jgi:small subunit ribosomal protein S1